MKKARKFSVYPILLECLRQIKHKVIPDPWYSLIFFYSNSIRIPSLKPLLFKLPMIKIIAT